MYLRVEELESALYSYQAMQIAENNYDILMMNIRAAEGEVRSYLAGRYDVETIFAAECEKRDPLLLELTKNIAVWYIVRLSNVDMLYKHAKERYDSAIDWLDRVADGKLNPDLPLKTTEDGGESGGISWGCSEPRNNNSY